MSTRFQRLAWLPWVVSFGVGTVVLGQDFRLIDAQFQGDGSGRLVYPSEPQSYYLLETSSDLKSFATTVNLALGQADSGEFTIPVAPGSLTRFYRVRRVPVAVPLDSDQDGLDDVYELQHPAELNPLSAADAQLDPDGDGVSTREERLRGTDPFVSNLLAQIVETSPAHGEGGVSVTRETILRFSQPLAAEAQLTATNLYASFGGRKLLARTELASDRRTATLFYLEQLPASARVRVTFNGSGVTGANGLPVDADGDGQPGGVALVDFDTLGFTPVMGTAVIGHVFASEKNPDGSNRPLEGVTITVDGAEETLRTTTRADGSFTLTNSPSGRFFVHVDGRTAVGSAWPGGAYYPFVGKAWEARPGVATNLANTTGEIFLPLVPQGSLQPVSATADTVVTFPAEVVAANPALAGVAVMVPANSLFSDNGTRGGRVGIAPVPPDRLPEPLPSGLSFPLVITIQTDGPSNIDRPVPVRFPNLPDPVTGEKLPPGAKSALWSFNHDTGRWEIQGPMTVTADGNYVETDPGVGVRQPGWHGSNPSTPSDPPDDDDPPCPGESMSNQAGCPGYPRTSLGAANCFADSAGAEFSPCSQTRAGPHAVPHGSSGFVPPFGDPGLVLLKSAFEDLPPVITQYLSTRESYQNLVNQEAELRYQIQTLLSGYSAPSELPPERRSAYEAAVGDLDRFLGGLTPSEFYAPSLSRFREAKANLSRLAGRTVEAETQVKVTYFAIQDLHSGWIMRKRRTSQTSEGFILSPNKEYRLLAWSVGSTHVFQQTFKSAAAGFVTSLRLAPLQSEFLVGGQDSDADGLWDLMEFVIGTNPNIPDTDGDGIPDGTEIQQGTNPLSGFPVATGVIAAAPTPGLAADVTAANDLAVTANRDAGITVFNVANPFNPLRIAQVDTPGNALRVAFSGNFVAVADDAAGLAIIDLSDPPAARIVHQVALGASATAVTAAGGVAYVGLDSGAVVSVDLATGTVLEQVNLGPRLVDLALTGDTLWALTTSSGSLHSLSVSDGLKPLGSVAISTVDNRRLSIGGGIAYVAESFNVTAVNVTDPASPVFAAGASIPGVGWLQLVPNGSGLALGPNVFGGAVGESDLQLYSMGDPSGSPRFLTVLSTPGYAHAVAIHNGLAYVADDTAGLQVVNYQSFDTQRKPPTLTLRPSFTLTTATNGIADEGQSLWIEALTTDDVQVRNVEFYLDGERVFTDGGFPFEHRFVAPAITATRTNFTVRARATDTGGNFTWSDEITVALTHDTTPPRVRRTVPANHGFAKVSDGIFVFFNEPLAAGAFNASSVTFTFAGADHAFDTSDDRPVTGAIFAYRDLINAGVIEFPDGLAQGLYRLRINPTLTDVAGNRIAEGGDRTFWVLTGGPEGDSDGDGVLNARELELKLNPLQGDSDGDGWEDGLEIADRTDPLNPASHPSSGFAVAAPPMTIAIPEPAEQLELSPGTFAATPAIAVTIPEPAELLDVSPGTYRAVPVVSVTIPEPPEPPDWTPGTFVAIPNLTVSLPESAELPDPTPGTYLALPSVAVSIPESAEALDLSPGTFLALPPVWVDFLPETAPAPAIVPKITPATTTSASVRLRPLH